MKLLIHTKFLLLVCLVTSMVMLSSCKKDKDATSDLIILSNFGPTGAMHGDTIRFFGANLQKVTQIDFVKAAIPAASFISQTNELILLKVPQSAEAGFVTLKTPQGDIISKTRFNLAVVPVISSMTKESRPGDNITIKGNFLNWITSVTFAKDKLDSNFVSKSLTELVVKVPADAETGKLVINYGGTKPLFFETDSVVIVTLPKVTGFSPNPVKHQTNLTITGTNLDLTRKINLPGVSAAVTSFVSQSATQIVLKVPSETVNGTVTLFPASNVPSVAPMGLTITYPAITTVAPNPVDIGANLTVTGTNLDLVNAISFQGVAAAVTTFVSQSATQLVVKVPTGAINGKLIFGIINTAQTVLSPNPLVIIGYVVPTGPSFPIYEDAVTSNWNGWIGGGWGGTVVLNNATPVKRGTASAKITYVSGGYGVPLQLGGANISLTPYSTFRVSIYGGTGSSGKSVNIGFNEADGKTVTVVEGAWTDFDIPLGQISATTKLTHLYLKNYSASGGFTIYVDDMGLN